MRPTILFIFAACLMLSSCEELGIGKTDSKSQMLAHDLTERGYKRLSEHKPEEALPLFNQAIAADAKQARTLQGKGLALSNLGKYSEAEDMYERALKIDPESVAIKNNLAMTHILQSDYKKAIEILT